MEEMQNAVDSKAGNYVAVGIAIGITVFALLGGLALTLTALRNMDLKLSLELKRDEQSGK